MSLAQRITDLAVAVRNKLNAMTPRLLPAGGSTGQALVKTSGADNAVGWGNPTGSDAWGYARLTSNVAITTTTNADVGLQFTAAANTIYEVEAFGPVFTSAATNGIGLGLDIPSGSVVGLACVPSSATAVAPIMQAADDTFSPTANAPTGDIMVYGKYLVQIGATGGAVKLRGKSELASGQSVTFKAGYVLSWRVVP